MEIPETAIREKYRAAEALLAGFDHAPRIAKTPEAAAPEQSPGLGTRRRFRTTTPGLVGRSTERPQGVHVAEAVQASDGNDPFASPAQATVLRALRRALATALATVDLYADQTPLADYMRANKEGRLAEGVRGEFGELLSGAALIALHVFANMTTHLLGNLEGSETEVGDIEEFLTDNPQIALHGALWELEGTLDGIASDAALVGVMRAFCEALMTKSALRASTARGLDTFTARAYRVEADGFTVEGFAPAASSRSTTLTMTFKKPHEVVGNHIAKYQSLKLAKMLMAYDFERRLNPFVELGGFIWTFMGDGMPGTGKTTLIQMMAGLLNDYCQVAGYPFRYQNLSTESIDSYQGKSAQNAKAFINAVTDPGVIGFGTVDDIDQLAGKRGDRQSSAGQLEITAVLMESFAGANTVVRGNCTFGMFSNYPENVDDALRQRAGARFLVDGPQTREDYIDILALLLGSRHDIALGDHDLYAAQALQKAVSASYESNARPHEEGLERVFDKVTKDIGKLDTLAKLGTYLKGIQEVDERFTGRSIKNITDAVKVRAMDIELPDEWMADPELFLFKDFDTKSAMIADLAKPITVEMIIQEINRYADSEFRYADKSDETAIEGMVREMERMEEAKRRYSTKARG